MSSLILNEKGAVAYRSTFLSLIDLFGLNLKNGIDIRNMSYTEFKDILDTCHKAYLSDPNQYLSLVGYRRSIDHIGQKMMYYIMMYIVRRYENGYERYKNILNWSHNCKKDLLRMARIYNMAFHPLRHENEQPELSLYTDTIFNFIKNNSNSDISDISDIAFKYIGTGHFDKENCLIKQFLNDRLTQHNLPTYTNSSLRKFYSKQKSKLHLGDSLLRGEKEDGSPIDEEYTVNYLKKMSAMAFKKMMETISNFENFENGYKKVLYQAYRTLREQISENKFSVKSTGINPILDCYEYYLSMTPGYENTVKCDSVMLESMLNKKLSLLRTRMKDNINAVKNKIDIVIDISVSMYGEPIKTAYYIALMLHKLYDINNVITFSDDAKRVEITSSGQDDWKGPIKSLYGMTQGSTRLHHIFPLLENNDNTTIIITDGDCDPVYGENPFQQALSNFPTRKFIVWNVKQKKLCFPYSSMDDRVGYITGNETGLIEAVFKNFPTTPIGLLYACLEDFVCPYKIDVGDIKLFSEGEQQSLYQSILKNIPTKFSNSNNNDDDDNDDNDDSDY